MADVSRGPMAVAAGAVVVGDEVLLVDAAVRGGALEVVGVQAERVVRQDRAHGVADQADL